MIQIRLDRDSATSLAQQVHHGIAAAIREGRLQPGARLPSWHDLASQLGIARGTVRMAYDRLADDQLVVATGSAGTRVVDRPPSRLGVDCAREIPPLPEIFRDFGAAVELFQMGVPAQDEFPVKTWSRIIANAAKAGALAPARYPDPRGEYELRQEIASYLAIARGISCVPSQIIVTAGYGSAISLAMRVLALEGTTAWVEDPGYPLTRTALGFAGIKPVAIPVDDNGLDVEKGIARAPDARLAIVTPGQQAPLGMTMSLRRRHALIGWAAEQGGWIIEDDYLGELQLKGRAAPALSSIDDMGRVIHVGTFSKTISPTIRLGFLIAPQSLVVRFGEAAASTAPAPTPVIQSAIAEFVREGHYLRHLRRMKRLYSNRRDLLLEHLASAGFEGFGEFRVAGTTIVLTLPVGTDDCAIVAEAHRHGLAPVALSRWYGSTAGLTPGLLLSITNYDGRYPGACRKLNDIIRSAGPVSPV